jgi:hypothetical protein
VTATADGPHGPPLVHGSSYLSRRPDQSVSAHATTSIAAGKIIGKDEKSGKTISGSCKDGDSLEIKDDHGVPVLSVK